MADAARVAQDNPGRKRQQDVEYLALQIRQSNQHAIAWLPMLLRVWSVLALATFVIMLTHQSDDAGFFDRYSTLVMGVLVGLAVFILIGISTSWQLSQHPALLVRIERRLAHWRRFRWFMPALLVVASSALILVWLYFLGNHLPTYSALRFFVVASILLAALALGFGGVPTDPLAQPTQNVKWLRLGILAAIVGIALLIVSFYPALRKTDEAFIFSIAWNALETGHTFPTIYRDAMPESYAAAGAWTGLMVAWLKFAGFGFTAGRLFILLMSFVTLTFIWAATKSLFDHMTAWFAVLIGAFAFMALNHIRYDFQTALLLAIGLYFFALAHKRGWWWAHFLTGFAVGFSIDGRPIAFSFGLGLAVAYLWQYAEHLKQERQWLWRPFWFMALGGLLALGAFLLTRAGASYFQTEGGEVGSMAATYANSLGTLSPVSQLNQYLTIFLTHQPILFGFTLFGCVIAFRQRTVADRLLLIMFIVWSAVVIFAYPGFSVFYIVHPLPICIMLSARGLTIGIPRLIGFRHGPLPDGLTSVVTLFVFVWLLADIANGIVNLKSDSLEDVVETGRRIAAIVPESATIVAAEPYYFGMPNHQNFIGGAAEGIQITRAGTSPEEVWPTINPDALVFSSGWPQEPARTPELVRFMEVRNFVKVNCWQTDSFGRIELWMAEIPAGVSPDEECIAVGNPRLSSGS